MEPNLINFINYTRVYFCVMSLWLPWTGSFDANRFSDYEFEAFEERVFLAVDGESNNLLMGVFTKYIFKASKAIHIFKYDLLW